MVPILNRSGKHKKWIQNIDKNNYLNDTIITLILGTWPFSVVLLLLRHSHMTAWKSDCKKINKKETKCSLMFYIYSYPSLTS